MGRRKNLPSILPKMSNYRIWLVEILTKDGRWIPMYQPCYSQAECEAIANLRRKWAGEDKVRVSPYVRDRDL